MNGRDHDHMHGMSPPSPSSSSSSSSSMMNHPKKMMHMTFFWGNYGWVLFEGWPGSSPGMYALCLVVIFFLAILTEWLGHSQFMKPGPVNRTSGLVQTLVYTLRVGFAYLLMLALMSFNGGVFLVAVAGHVVAFLVFGSRFFRDSGDRKTADLPKPVCAC